MSENSKYDYLKEILEEEFPAMYWKLHELSLLEPEVRNVLTLCEPIFDEMGFDEDDRFLRYAVIGEISEYVEAQKSLA